jgi:hypothetical protein
VSATQVVRMPSGGTLSVRSGILRGAGPAGPQGPAGPRGERGLQGEAGPPGSINDYAGHLRSSAPSVVSDDQWYVLPLEELVTGDVVEAAGDYAFSPLESGRYLVAAVVVFDAVVGGSTTGSRSVRLVNQANSPLGTEWEVPATVDGRTVVELVVTEELNPSFNYSLQAMATDTSGVTSSLRDVRLTRIGAGPPGPVGPKGPVGSTGPAGPQGPAGEAAGGFSTFNAVIGGGDSTAEATALATADQALPYPEGTISPRVPYFLRALATSLERRLVSRFASAADRDAWRATRNVGEIYVLTDTGVPYYREANGTEAPIARVTLSTSAAPTGAGQAAPGALWIQY